METSKGDTGKSGSNYGRVAKARDRLARKLCNLILKTIATQGYHDSVEGLINLGVYCAERYRVRPRDYCKRNLEKRKAEVEALKEMWRRDEHK